MKPVSIENIKTTDNIAKEVLTFRIADFICNHCNYILSKNNIKIICRYRNACKNHFFSNKRAKHQNLIEVACIETRPVWRQLIRPKLVADSLINFLSSRANNERLICYRRITMAPLWPFHDEFIHWFLVTKLVKVSKVFWYVLSTLSTRLY